MKTIEEIANTRFAKDVERGLSLNPKRISSKYFYDKKGDEIFQKIMRLDDYYLTRAEFEIFLNHSSAIVDSLELKSNQIEIIELGAGDATKTLLLIKELSERGLTVIYKPIDISASVLQTTTSKISKHFPEVTVEPITASYEDALGLLQKIPSQSQKLFLFLGSNLGNLNSEEAHEFVLGIAQSMAKDDCFLIGLDKMKNPEVILRAYNDSEGVTSEFNLNLLDRMNRELGTSFDRSLFKHIATYDPGTGTAKSFLVSKKRQSVHLPWCGRDIILEKFESIHTEISQKYNEVLVEEIFAHTGLKRMKYFEDSNEYFRDYLFVKQ